MSLRSFLYAVEAFRFEQMGDFHVEQSMGRRPANVVERNQDAMSQLMGAMAGVKGGPTVKP